jgi:ribonucleoside-triphosphate reductase
MDGKQAIADFVFASTYARYDDALGRRETFDEAVERMESMHFKRYGERAHQDPYFCDTVRRAFTDVQAKRVLASQRALQFGGEPVLRKNMRIYNCATSYCDRPRFFAEALYMGLCGVGVGFSVQSHHTDKLPVLTTMADYTSRPEQEYTVADSIEGWADAVGMLMDLYFGEGPVPLFDFSEIRPKGARISAGGTAPGSEPLEVALDKIDELLYGLVADGVQKLRPIHCFDLAMFASEAVISGGRRRAATIALFDKDDEEMLNAKTGDWFKENKQRSLANISAVQVLGEESREDFSRVIESAKQYGEPGVIFTHSREYVYNPCVEIGMCPTLIRDHKGEIVKNYTLDMLNNQDAYKKKGYTFESGWQTCNLTEINGAAATTREKFLQAAVSASVIGTLQAGYTQPGYLTRVTQDILEREALIGVSITGIMDNPELLLDEALLKEAANLVVETNEKLAYKIGVNTAARCTCVKPAGTTSILLGTASGIHPHFGRRVIRHIQMNKDNPALQLFAQHNPTLVEESQWSANGTDLVVAFPLEFPEHAVVKGDLNAIAFLERVRQVQRAWVMSGTADVHSCEKLRHNVSNTCAVQEHEWYDVEAYLWKYRYELTGVAMLGDTGEMCYPQLPNQAVLSLDEYRKRFGDEAAEVVERGELPTDVTPLAGEDMDTMLYHAKGIHTFARLQRELAPVPYAEWREDSDMTTPTADAACAGGSCEVAFL